MKTYFLSYSRLDQDFTLRLANDLRAAGVDVWIDQMNIVIGQNWDREVEAAVRSCKGFIIVLSPHSAVSENVADELSVALDGGKHIIPILHSKCTVPLRLARAQFIDATVNYAAALQRCVNIILNTGDDARGPISALASGEASGPAAVVTAPKVSAPPAVTPAAGSPPAEAAVTLQPEMVDKLCGILTHYLGPIARHVLVSEARAATSRDDLYDRLGSRISNAKERAELLATLRSS